PGSGSSLPNHLTAVGGTLFFSAFDPAHGIELWKSDGTAAGTVLAADINLGSHGSYPSDLAFVNGALFFSADDGQNGREPWILTVAPPAANGAAGPTGAPGLGSSLQTAPGAREPEPAGRAPASATTRAPEDFFLRFRLDHH